MAARFAREAADHQRGIARVMRENQEAQSQSLRESMQHFAQLGLTVAGIVASIGVAFVGVAASIARSVVHMIAFRQGAITTLRVLLGGNQAQAEQRFERTRRISSATGLNPEELVRSDQQVATAGFRGRQADAVLAASADVGAANAGDSTASSRFVRAVGQIRSKGRLQMEELQGQLADVGIGFDPVARALGQQMNLRGAGGRSLEGAALSNRVRQMISHGQISGDQGVRAVLEAVRSNVSGGTLGGLAQQRGQGLGGALERLQNAPMLFMMGLSRIENSPGMVAVARLLNGLSMTLAGATPLGQRFQGVVFRIVNSLGMLAESVDLGSVQKTLGNLFDTVSRLWPVAVRLTRAFSGGFMEGLHAGLTPMLEGFRALSFVTRVMLSGFGGTGVANVNLLTLAMTGLGRTIGAIVGGVAAVVTVMVAAAAAFGTVFGSAVAFATSAAAFVYQQLVALPSMFLTLGSSIVDGLIQGLRDSWGRLTGELTALAEQLPGPVRRALDMHSPSRVFADLGRQVSAGMAVGIDEGAPRVDAAVTSMVQAPSSAAGRGGSMPSSIGPFYITVEHGPNAEQTASELREQLESLFTDIFERATVANG